MENIIIHIFTIGFHHKRGCEIEFIYPPLSDECNFNKIDIWKNLPSLALPDGAHKSSSDTINFIIPGLKDSSQKILFGISCFKQVSAESVKTKSDDITRNTVQKSVVVLATLPLFGAISSLLRGITENYFEIGNFEERIILIESFHQLNKHFQLILEDNQKKYSGITAVVNQELSITNLIGQYEHDILTLIKLVLLRRKVLFFMEPMEKLTTTILSLLSLFPGIMETTSFQNSLELVEKIVIDTTLVQPMPELSLKESPNKEVNDTDKPDSIINKSNSGELKSSPSYSLLQNLKSGGGHTIKAFGNLATSGVGAAWWGSRSPDTDNNKQHSSEDLSIPLPSFLNKDGYGNHNKNSFINEQSKDNWGFPLDIVDKRNILLPYVNIGMLNILDNDEINSFILGANNQLWKMKLLKYDVIIHEDNKNCAIEFCQLQSQNKQDDFHVTKLLQLTVADRRFADYLLQVVKYHYKHNNSSAIIKSDTSDLNPEIVEDNNTTKVSETMNVPKFSDSKELEDWLRQVLLDYIKSILLNAAALGSKTSFEDFGWNFMITIQQQSYFENWYNAIDRNKIVDEASANLRKILTLQSSPSLNLSSQAVGDNVELDNAWKPHSVMNYDHPGRFIQPKIGDTIPGYYQFKEYADQSKALVNKSVNEIRKFGSERGVQLKSSMTAGFSKLTSMAKDRGLKLGSTWWSNENRADNKFNSETENNDE